MNSCSYTKHSPPFASTFQFFAIMLNLDLKTLGFFKLTIIAVLSLLAVALYLQDNLLATVYRYGEFVSNFSTANQMWFKNADWSSELKNVNEDQLDVVSNTSNPLQEILKNLSVRVSDKVITARTYANQEQKRTNYSSFCQGNFIAVDVSEGRLGNLMFQTASLLGISTKLQRQVFFLKKYSLFDSFEGFWVPSPMPEYGSCSWKLENFKAVSEAGAGIYTPKLEHHNLTNEVKPVLLSGYMQSWRYFDEFRGSIKLLFTFKQSIYDKAIKVIHGQLRKFFQLKGPAFMEHPTLVGIHVRRKDYVNGRYGRSAVPDAYLLKQLTEFREKHQNVVFLIASDDLTYCLKLFRGNDVFFLHASSPEVDMAALSLADHVVISVGSYGWWIAYLSDAQSVTYYEPWLNQSVLKDEYPKGDYFLPEWRGINL